MVMVFINNSIMAFFSPLPSVLNPQAAPQVNALAYNSSANDFHTCHICHKRHKCHWLCALTILQLYAWSLLTLNCLP